MKERVLLSLERSKRSISFLFFTAPENPQMTSKIETAKLGAPENAFHDLSSFSSMFRGNIIAEFQVLDNVHDSFNVSAPIYSSRDFYSGKAAIF